MSDSEVGDIVANGEMNEALVTPPTTNTITATNCTPSPTVVIPTVISPVDKPKPQSNQGSSFAVTPIPPEYKSMNAHLLSQQWTVSADSMGSMLFQVNGIPYMSLGSKPIGKGGSSSVYKVMSPWWEIYALKVVNLAEENEQTMQSYLNEVELLAKLDSPYVIGLVDHEFVQSKQELLILLEFAELDLNKLLKEFRPSDLTALRFYWKSMLQSVEAIHENRIVHGDLKPQNFVLAKGQVKLIDFGIAKAMQNNTTNIVREDIVGTANYLSPEAINGYSGKNTWKLGRVSDVWSLGCILYQMVYGHTPFSHIGNLLHKLTSITNPNHEIFYGPLGAECDGLLDVMKLCLTRNAKARPTVTELLQHPFLL